MTGIVDAQITGARVELKTDAIVRTQSAKEINAGQRMYGLVEEKLAWVYDMAIPGTEMSSHVSFLLSKQA